MGTWVAAIVKTRERSDFWDVASTLGIEQVEPSTPAHALINCFDFQASVRLAEKLSRELSTTSLGFVAQTSADVHELQVFEDGRCIRQLCYSRDGGGWLEIHGTPQAWERVYFFDDNSSTTADGRWPDMLHDELSDEDIVRYEKARLAGDPSKVMDLLHPSSMSPMLRVCASFGIKPERSSGRWRKPSLWSRIVGRTG